jgi:tetratricopeptide (TPR) repeat protein
VLSSFLSDLKKSQAGYLALLAAMAVFRGGRETAGLAVYFIFSFWIVLQALREDPRFPDSPIGRPLRAFLLLTFLSACAAFALRMRGLLQWTAILSYALHFQILLRDRSPDFEKTFLKLIVGLGLLFGLTALPLGFGVTIRPLFPNYNLLMSFVNCAILICVARLLSGPPIEKPWERYGLASTLILMMIGEWFAFSRAALFALAAGLGVCMIPSRGRRFWGVILVGIALGLGAVVFSGGTARYVAGKITSLGTDARWTVWRGAEKAWEQKPLLGWGLGRFAEAYRLNRYPLDSEIARYQKLTRFAHNETLQLAVETGAIGVALWLWIIFAGIRSSFRSAVRPESDWKKKAGTACIAALLAQSVFDFNFHLPVLSLLLVFFAARVLEPDPEKGVDLPPAFSAAARGICMAGILFSSIALLAQTCAAWGRFNESRKNLEAALAARQWSVRLNPIHPELLDALALQSAPQDAERYLRRALKLRPEDDVLNDHLARLFIYERRMPEAESVYERAIALNPAHAFYYADLAELRAARGDTPSAEDLYRRAVGAEPFYAYGHFRLAELLRDRGQLQEAEACFRNALAIAEHPEVQDYRSRAAQFSPYVDRLLRFEPQAARTEIDRLLKEN